MCCCYFPVTDHFNLQWGYVVSFRAVVLLIQTIALALFSPKTLPALPVPPASSAAPASSSSLWPWAAPSPVSLYLSWTGEPSSGTSTPDMAHQCWRGRIASPGLLAVLVVMQPRLLLATFAMKGALLALGQLVGHQDPKVHLWRPAFQLVSPTGVPVPGLLPSRMQDFAFPLLYFMRLLFVQYFSLSRSV